MRSNHKIKSIDELTEITARKRSQKKRSVLCHGCFDLLHIGHIRYLQSAREMGDLLIVTVTPDRFVDKGPHRPAFPEALRAEAIASLDCVDYVAINNWPTAEETLRRLQPAVYVKGSDFTSVESDMTGKLAREAQVVKEIGAELQITRDIVFSSTNLINRFFSGLSDEVEQYFHRFRTRYQLGEILGLIDRMADLRVLLVGDTILNEYHCCSLCAPLYRNTPLMAQRDCHRTVWGGVPTIANNVAGLARNVTLMTAIGASPSHEELIRGQLDKRISARFAVRETTPTTTRKCFVDQDTRQELFEVYIAGDLESTEASDRQLARWIQNSIKEHDLVIAVDFGHGAVRKKLREDLAAQAPFLAVVTDTNGKRASRTLGAYSHIDFCIADEHEVRAVTYEFQGGIESVVGEFRDRLGCSRYLIDRGGEGCLVGDDGGNVMTTPAFSEPSLDPNDQAGLSVAALAAFLKAPPELIGFLWSAAEALSGKNADDPYAPDGMKLKKYVTALMK